MILRFISLILIGVAIFIGVETFLPEESHRKLQNLFLSGEQKVLFSECETARQTLQQQGLPSRYTSVDFMIRDERLKNDPVLRDLQKCFPSSPKSSSPVRLEVELFSSDFGQESSADLQVQVSAFDIKSGNKVAEVGFRIDHEPVKKSDSTIQRPPKAPSAEREAQNTDRR